MTSVLAVAFLTVPSSVRRPVGVARVVIVVLERCLTFVWVALHVCLLRERRPSGDVALAPMPWLDGCAAGSAGCPRD